MKFVHLNYEGKNRPCKAILPGLGKSQIWMFLINIIKIIVGYQTFESKVNFESRVLIQKDLLIESIFSYSNWGSLILLHLIWRINLTLDWFECRESLSLSKTSGQRNSADFSVVDCEVEEDLEELSEWHAPVEPVECGIGIEGIIGCEDCSDICENVGVNGESCCDLSGEGLNDERGVEVKELSK